MASYKMALLFPNEVSDDGQAGAVRVTLKSQRVRSAAGTGPSPEGLCLHLDLWPGARSPCMKDSLLTGQFALGLLKKGGLQFCNHRALTSHILGLI